METIEIRVVRRGKDVEVVDAEGRTTGPLCMGECLEQVIGLIYAEERKTYPMHTPAHWAERGMSFARPDYVPEKD